MPPLNTPSRAPHPGEPTADDLAGMAWYNAQTEETLRFWHGIAGSAAAVDAWIAYRDTAGNACPPPAANTAASLPAPAAGQGEGALPQSEAFFRSLLDGMQREGMSFDTAFKLLKEACAVIASAERRA